MSVTFDFSQKTIAVTGAASGIGRATAQLLASSGARLSLADVQKEALEELVAELDKTGEGRVTSHIVDVSKAEQVNSWIRETVEKHGKLDGAANLAGVIGKDISINGIEAIGDDDWAFIIGINLQGVMHCIRAEIQSMNPNGSIVNASSIAGVTGMAKNGSYVAAKHGVVGLTRTAAKEVGDRGIRVNCVAP